MLDSTAVVSSCAKLRSAWPVSRAIPSSNSVWLGLAAAGGAVALAAVALRRRRPPARVRARVRPAMAPVTVLRTLHTGHVGDYVMWLTIGLAAFGGLVIVAVH